MLRKLFRRNNNSLIFALLTLALVFFFRFFLRGEFSGMDYWKITIFYLGAFFLLPWGIIRFIYKKKITDFFFKKNFFEEGEIKKQAFGVFLWVGFFLILMLKFNQWKNFPVSPWILGKWELVFFLDVTFLPLILFFQEFFFRGFLLKIFSEQFKDWWAIIIQAGLAISFEGLFDGRNFLIGMLSFLFSCYLGWVSLKNKNFLLSWGIVFFISLVFDLVVKYKIGTIVLSN